MQVAVTVLHLIHHRKGLLDKVEILARLRVDA